MVSLVSCEEQWVAELQTYSKVGVNFIVVNIRRLVMNLLVEWLLRSSRRWGSRLRDHAGGECSSEVQWLHGLPLREGCSHEAVAEWSSRASCCCCPDGTSSRECRHGIQCNNEWRCMISLAAGPCSSSDVEKSSWKYLDRVYRL